MAMHSFFKPCFVGFLSSALAACGSAATPRGGASDGGAAAPTAPARSPTTSPTSRSEDGPGGDGGAGGSDAADGPRPDDTVDFSKLSAGLYWFGRDARMQRADDPRPSAYYAPDKPTLIYVHGWQQGAVAAGTHESTVRAVASEKVDLARSWIDKGYNVGFFLWTQFADDQLLTAEQKIWDGKAMTWLDSGGNRHPFEDGRSASELFLAAYASALRDFRGPEIRVAGHSLGSQMASVLVSRVAADVAVGALPPALLPSRLILLDPFLSAPTKSYLGNVSNADTVHQKLQEPLQMGVSLEIYRTSSLSFLPGADAYPALVQEAAFRNVYTDSLFTAAQQADKHVYAVAYYFWSFASDPRPLQPGSAAPPEGLPSRCVAASSKKEDILQFMSAPQQAKSTDAATATPTDDLCTLEAKGTF